MNSFKLYAPWKVMLLTVLLGHGLAIAAQGCFDMTSLGTSKFIICQDEDLTISQKTLRYTDQYTTIDIPINYYQWQNTKVLNKSGLTRHILCQTAKEDAICKKICTLPPSGKPSICLKTRTYEEDDIAQGANIVFKHVLTEENPVIIINYAAILEKTFHDEAYASTILNIKEYVQPSITIKITVGSSEDQVIKETIITHQPYDKTSLEGFKSFSGTDNRKYLYKDWDNVAYDLSKFVGKQINVFAEVRDCAIEGYHVEKQSGENVVVFDHCEEHHSARLYLNVDCAPDTIQAQQDCDKNEVILVAPQGFEYQWYEKGKKSTILGYEDTLIVSTDKTDRTFYCELSSKAISLTTKLKAKVNNICFCEYTMDPLQPICADADSVTLNFDFSAGHATAMKVEYNDLAQKAGFNNYTRHKIWENEASFTFPMPAGEPQPGTYHATLTVTQSNQRDSIIPLDFTVLYPASIIHQIWNDILYIHEDSTKGHIFTNVQWMKNNEAIQGRGNNNSYYYSPSLLDANDSYSARLTDKNGNTHCTCAYQPRQKSNEITLDFKVSQQRVANQQRIVLQSNQQGEYALYNVMGAKITQGELNNQNITLPVTLPAGTYIFYFKAQNGDSDTKKLYIGKNIE